MALAVGLALLAPTALAAGPEGALDFRAWEMVSPPDKSGGEVEAPGKEGAGVLQASAAGLGAIAFASATSFGEAEGAAPVSQYLSSREAAAWSTANLTPPQLSATYTAGAYALFSTDLSRALLTNGWACRDAVERCAAANPPLGSGAPAGYRNLYLREGPSYTPLITTANSPALGVSAEDFKLALSGATPDLHHAVISTCAALTSDAEEVPGLEGCEAADQNLYEWSEGTLKAVNLLPGDTQGTPGATLAASSGAISSDGSRVYWSEAGNLYLREGNNTVQVDESLGGGGSFQTASFDGSIAYFTKEEHLYHYNTTTHAATDLIPTGEVQGVLGASEDGSYLYYLSAAGLYVWHEGTTTKAATAADASNYPPAIGTARVTPDGSRLAFLSKASLTGYANVGKAEVFLYEAPTNHLLCVSCNPRGNTPFGPSTIPGALAAGEAGPPAYKPRALSADGSRVFFDSADFLLFNDTDARPDAYEWQAKGTGGCTKAAGCIGLLSSGRVGEASFLDASADGTDAYFLADASLLGQDTGSRDIYDAHAGGGFGEAQPQIPCEGDDCQGPPSAPEDPTPGTATFDGPTNPPLRFAKTHPKKSHPKKHHHGHPRHRHRHKGQR